MSTSAEAYSVPQEAWEVLQKGILENPLLGNIPAELKSFTKNLHFEGNSKPSIPVNWRFAESITALKGFEALMLNLLITRKYNTQPVDVTINTDHASLFILSPVIAQIIKDGKPTPLLSSSGGNTDLDRLFPNEDKHDSGPSPYRGRATNIYETKDGRFYHCHGGLNPDPTLTVLGLPLEGRPEDTMADPDGTTLNRFKTAVAKFDADTLDEVINEEHKQAGTICHTADEYFNTPHGQANSKVGLYEIYKHETSSQPASWWKDDASYLSSAKRPLAGLKVIDLTRVIASPVITRTLAEMGASVMRVTSLQVTDFSLFHHDLNWGKWNCHLHLKNEEDKEKLRQLIREADVVVDGYRPDVMERLGFGREAIFELVKDRGYGIIHVQENCYGWHGPWSHRAGWQQISDACCGVSMGYGKALGHNEPVTPPFPNSDYCTGVCGSIAVLQALIDRAEKGGSYAVDVALNYYSQWLIKSCGEYPADVWKDVWGRHGNHSYRHYEPMMISLPATTGLLLQIDKEILFKPEFFEARRAENLGETFIFVKPIAQFGDNALELKFHVGTRGNGTDKPVWPKDLTVQVVTREN
ncbi:hypothetical protein AA313_de0205210 [Arthrobotrys entomopaga]|nr:hypothetical protein AA313_de0205210 [Arthrobotrys entomopaga]